MPGQSAAVLSYKALTKENRIQVAFLHLIMFPPNQYIYMTVKYFLKRLLAFKSIYFFPFGQDIENLVLKTTYFLVIFQQN